MAMVMAMAMLLSQQYRYPMMVAGAGMGVVTAVEKVVPQQDHCCLLVLVLAAADEVDNVVEDNSASWVVYCTCSVGDVVLPVVYQDN